MVPHPAKIVATYLVNQGVGKRPSQNPTVEEWVITEDQMPEEGNQPWITVFDTSGTDQQGRHMRTGDRQEFYAIQVRVRAVGDVEAKAKGEELTAIFDGIYRALVNITEGLFTIHHVKVVSPLTFLKQQERYEMRDHVMSCKVRLYKES